MRMTNNFRLGPVWWRVFDPTDRSHIVGLVDGVLQPGSPPLDYNNPHGQFQIEIKRNGFGGQQLVTAGEIFSNADMLTLTEAGRLERSVAISRRVSGFDVTRDTLPFENRFPMSAFPVQEIAGIRITRNVFGLCGGMTYTVRDYFEAGRPVPGTTTVPTGGPLFDYLWRRLIDSFNLPFGPGNPAHYLHLMNPALPDHETDLSRIGLAPHGRAWIMINEEWPRIRAALDANQLCPITLIETKSLDPGAIFDNHQVLAYGYDLRGNDLTIWIYDPNSPRTASSLSLSIANPYNTTAVTHSDGSPVNSFFKTDYTFVSPHISTVPQWDSGWRSIGRMVASSPDLASRSADHLAVVARGIDSQVWCCELASGQWGSWDSLGGNIVSDPAIVSGRGSNRLDVFGRGSDNAIWHKSKTGSWSNWESLGGQWSSGPDANSWGADHLEVFVRGTDNALWHKWNLGQWSSWESLGGSITSDPTSVSWGQGRVDVFARGTDMALWHRWFDGTWHDWESLGGQLTSGPDVASMGPNHLDVFVKGTDGALWHRWFDGTWRDWSSLGGLLTSDPAAVSRAAGKIDVVARGADFGLWIKQFS